MILNVERVISRPPINVLRLREFLEDFARNIEQEYPSPSYMPPLAGQSIIDVQSYTKWRIELKRVLLGERLPTKLALTALTEVEALLSRHGPASMKFLVKDANTVYARGLLTVQRLVAINTSLPLLAL